MADRVLKRVLLSASVLGCLFSCVVIAEAQGGPPMITDDTETVPEGHWEINSGFTVERGVDGRVFEMPLEDINYGLSKHLQLKVEVPWIVLHPNGVRGIHGIGATNIGVRWRFRDEDEHHRIAISTYPQFSFNNDPSSARRGLVDRGPQFLLPIQVQTKVGKFGINADYGWLFRPGDDHFSYGVVIGRELNERVEILAEVHAESIKRLHLDTSEAVYNLGSRIGLTKHTTLLLSAGKSIRPNFDPRFIGYAGLQVTF